MPFIGVDVVETTLVAIGTSALAVIRRCVESGGGRGGWTSVVRGEPGQGLDLGREPIGWIETGLLSVSVYGRTSGIDWTSVVAMPQIECFA